MKKVVLLLALSFLIVSGSLRADSPRVGQLSVPELRAAIFAPAEPGQASPSSARVASALRFPKICSASVVCTDGTTRSCTGTTLSDCYTQPQCFVQCSGHTYLCSSPCP
jgi:hypothetical protein